MNTIRSGTRSILPVARRRHRHGRLHPKQRIRARCEQLPSSLSFTYKRRVAIRQPSHRNARSTRYSVVTSLPPTTMMIIIKIIMMILLICPRHADRRKLNNDLRQFFTCVQRARCIIVIIAAHCLLLWKLQPMSMTYSKQHKRKKENHLTPLA